MRYGSVITTERLKRHMPDELIGALRIGFRDRLARLFSRLHPCPSRSSAPLQSSSAQRERVSFTANGAGFRQGSRGFLSQVLYPQTATRTWHPNESMSEVRSAVSNGVLDPAKQSLVF